MERKNCGKICKKNRLKNLSKLCMQRIRNSENLESEKQDLKRKMKFHGVNIENKIKLY